jgi:hypothetical protein
MVITIQMPSHFEANTNTDTFPLTGDIFFAALHNLRDEFPRIFMALFEKDILPNLEALDDKWQISSFVLELALVDFEFESCRKLKIINLFPFLNVNDVIKAANLGSSQDSDELVLGVNLGSWKIFPICREL